MAMNDKAPTFGQDFGRRALKALGLPATRCIDVSLSTGRDQVVAVKVTYALTALDVAAMTAALGPIAADEVASLGLRQSDFDQSQKPA